MGSCEIEDSGGEEIMDRNLDGCYFRIERNGKWQNVCFSDLTDDEMDRVLDGKGFGFMRGLVMHLAHRIQSIGDAYDLMGE